MYAQQYLTNFSPILSVGEIALFIECRFKIELVIIILLVNKP